MREALTTKGEEEVGLLMQMTALQAEMKVLQAHTQAQSANGPNIIIIYIYD